MLPKMNTRKAFFLALLSVTILAAGCRYDMQDQPKLKYYRQSDFFADEKGMRPLVEGTVPRGYLRADKALYTGKRETGTVSNAATQGQTSSANAATTSGTAAPAAFSPDLVTEFPLPVTKELLDRGEERFRIFCIVCHGPNGEGNGMVVRRGFTRPPSYLDERLRNAPVGHFFDVMTNGFGRMPSYAAQVPVQDRWAIAAYIRALQAANPNITPGAQPSPAATPQTRAQINAEKNGGEN